MNVEQIIINPITTPDYPDPTERRRFIDDPDARVAEIKRGPGDRPGFQ